MVHKIGRGGPSPLPQETPADNVNTSTQSETKTPALAPEENRHPTSATEQKVRTAKFTELQLTGMARAAELSNSLPGPSESNKIDAFTLKEKTIEDPTGEPQTSESKAWHMANFRMTIDTSSTNEATEPRRADDTDAHNKSEKK